MSLSTFFSIVPTLAMDFLRTDETLREVPMHAITDRNIADAMALALSGAQKGPTEKVGISLVFAATATGGSTPNTPAFWNASNTLLITAFELPAINHDSNNPNAIGISGPDLLAAIVAMLKRFSTGEAEFTNIHFREPENAIDFPDVDADTGVVVWRARLLFPGGVEDVSTVVASPSISQGASQSITISCATSGAEIYYTTDGTRPMYYGASSTSNIGTLYSGAFTGTVGNTVTARAFKTGNRASILSRATVT